jgi:glyoxylase-like metal-dependent hydrolase (beta-lactamase superfamily II)
MLEPAAPISRVPITRRTVLIDLGRGAVALAVFGIAACAPASTPGGSAAASSPSSPSTEPSVASSSSGSASPEPSAVPSASASASGEGFDWRRVDLGFVSAYILARDGEAALVDTGVAGSADAIEGSLGSIGLDWGALGHVIVTHLHGDHAGSTSDVMAAAPEAQGYAGQADIPGITAPRPLTAVADGDEIMGLRIVATPGHTPGHIAVLDPIGGILVAGDALNTANGAASGPNPGFTADMATANASVKTLAGLRFETLLVGHGEPIESGASASVAALAATL